MRGIGERLKSARLGHQPPLRLVDVAGDRLTAGMLSKIERGRVSPSLATLGYLAERLEVPLAELFGAPPGPDGDPWDALSDARATLWLGEPADASRRALAVSASREGAGAGEASGAPDAAVRAAALGLAAEAALERGETQESAGLVAAASAVLSAARAGPAGAGAPRLGAVEAQLIWVLGLLERRRGRSTLAERSWSHCLDVLESLPGPAPGERLLRARVLCELGGLHGAAGSVQGARLFLIRAGEALRRLGDPEEVARDLLTAPGEASDAAGLDGRPGGRAAAGSEARRPAAAGDGRGGRAPEVLAAVAAARRLREQVARDLARLDGAALLQPAGSPPEVPHSRHLR